MQATEPLRYPPHFPPTSRWKRFFLGVRWLGPDLSFFRDLKSAQEARTPELMELWGGGSRQELAAAIGSAIARHCRWPQPHFLPGDSFALILGGPNFDWANGVDDVDIRCALDEIEELIGVKIDPGFWEASGSVTLGEVVDALREMAGPNYALERPNGS